VGRYFQHCIPIYIVLGVQGRNQSMYVCGSAKCEGSGDRLGSQQIQGSIADFPLSMRHVKMLFSQL